MTIPDSAVFVSGSKAGRGVSRGGGRGGTDKGKLDSRGRCEGLPSQAKITCNHCQKPGHIRPNCPDRQCFNCRGWGHEAFPAHPRFRFRKRMDTIKRKTIQLLWW